MTLAEYVRTHETYGHTVDQAVIDMLEEDLAEMSARLDDLIQKRRDLRARKKKVRGRGTGDKFIKLRISDYLAETGLIGGQMREEASAARGFIRECKSINRANANIRKAVCKLSKMLPLATVSHGAGGSRLRIVGRNGKSKYSFKIAGVAPAVGSE